MKLRSSRRWIPDVTIVALQAGLAFLFYWRVTAPNPADRATFPSGDFIHQFYGFTVFESKEWWAGRLPLWNPYAFSGHPFLADVQAAVFYPLSLLMVVLSLIWTGGSFPFIALEMEAIVHTFLASAFTYAFVRHVTGHRGAALLAGLTFAYGGYLTGYPPLQLAILETDVWLPLVLLLLHRALTFPYPDAETSDHSRSQPAAILAERASAAAAQPATASLASVRLNLSRLNLASALGAGLTLGVAILAGHPQSAMYVTYVVLLYFAFLAWPHRRQWPVLLVLFAVLAVTAGGLAAVAWLPGLEFMRLSTRASANFAELSGGFEPRDLVQMLIPGWISVWSPLYVGILPLALVAVALVLRPARAVVFWVAVAAGALLLSFGCNMFLYPLFYLFVPGFNLFQSQERAAFVVSFTLAVLAGYGAAALFRGGGEWTEQALEQISRGVGLATIGALVAVGALLFAWSDQGRQTGTPLASLLNLVSLLALWLVATFGLLRARRSVAERAWFALAAGLLVINLFTANVNTNIVTRLPPELGPVDPLVARIQADSGIFRVSNDGRLQPNYGLLANIEDTWGASPLHLQRYDDFVKAVPEVRRWQLLNVKYVITKRQEVPTATLIGQEGQGDEISYLHQLADPGARAFLVHMDEAVPDDQVALARLSDPAFDIKQSAIVAVPAPVDTAGVGGAADRVTVVGRRPGWLSLAVETDHDGLLVVSEQAYPGWRAWLDGREVPLIRADVILQSVSIPAGRHHVELLFDPWSVKIGLAITLLTALLGGGELLWLAYRPHSRRFQ